MLEKEKELEKQLDPDVAAAEKVVDDDDEEETPG